MSNDLSLPRPGRLQVGKRTRVGRKRRPHHGDPAPMNMNATAQMVTTTQRGCETDHDLKRKLDIAIKALELGSVELGSCKYWPELKAVKEALDAAIAKINSYPLPTGRTK